MAFRRLSHPGDVPHLAITLKRQLVNAQETYAPIDNPSFTGDPQAPTPPTPDNDTSIATTAFVKNQNYAPLASPVFTGDPKAPTPPPADNDTSIATTAFVHTVVAAAGGGGSGGIPEAPLDGITYGRQNAVWTHVLMATGDIVDGGNF
jgi:hypothetical protein